MKKILILYTGLFCTTAIAQTINWYVDDVLYQTTTCESGDNVTPPTPPEKYGYTFQWWYDNSTIEGTWEQSGTPSPRNPIYPNFYQNGNLVLRAIGTDNKRVFDTYNMDTGIITRRIAVRILDGTEGWWDDNDATYVYTNFSKREQGSQIVVISSHFTNGQIIKFMGVNIGFRKSFLSSLGITGSIDGIKNFLAEQYANGTPVTIYYPLATPVTENYTSVSNQ